MHADMSYKDQVRHLDLIEWQKKNNAIKEDIKIVPDVMSKTFAEAIDRESCLIETTLNIYNSYIKAKYERHYWHAFIYFNKYLKCMKSKHKLDKEIYAICVSILNQKWY